MALSPRIQAWIRRIGFAAIAAVALVAGPADGTAQAGRTILEYDEDGRAAGVITGKEIRGNEPGAAEDETDHEPGEILAIDPPRTILPRLQAMGYALIESLKLESLKLEVWRIAIPDSMSTNDALNQFQRSFPRVLTDFNSHYALSAAPDAGEVLDLLEKWVGVHPC